MGSEGNLVWKNDVRRSGFEGIQVGPGGSEGNWIVQNVLQENADDGVDVFSNEERNNALIGNHTSKNVDQGFEIFGVNTIALDNKVFDNEGNGIGVNSGESSVLLDNEIKDNSFYGIDLEGYAFVVFLICITMRGLFKYRTEIFEVASAGMIQVLSARSVLTLIFNKNRQDFASFK